MQRRKYIAFYDDGHDFGEIVFFSTHRANSKANIQDAKNEISKRYGNRRINGEIYAGTILVAADDGCGGTKDLTEEQVREYAGKLWQPEDISPAEVADVHYSFTTFDSDKEFFAALGFDM